MAATWSAPFTLNNLVSFNPIYLTYGRIRKIHELHLPCKFWDESIQKNMSSSPSKFPHSFLWQNLPFISDDVHVMVSDMTLTAELSPKFVPSIQFCPLTLNPGYIYTMENYLTTELFCQYKNCLSSSIRLQLLAYSLMLNYLFKLSERQNFNAYRLRILFHRPNCGKISDYYFTSKFLPLNFSHDFQNLVGW